MNSVRDERAGQTPRGLPGRQGHPGAHGDRAVVTESASLGGATAPRSIGHAATRQDIQARRDAALRALSDKVRGSCTVSFGHLYDLTSPGLLGLILAINPDRTQAERALEETFVEAWRHRSRLDVDTCGSWLAAVARDAALASLGTRPGSSALARCPALERQAGEKRPGPRVDR